MDPGNVQGLPKPTSPEEDKHEQSVDPEKFKRILRVEESDEAQKRNKRKMTKTEEEGEDEEPEETAAPPPGMEFQALLSGQKPDQGILGPQAASGKTGGAGGPKQAPSLFETVASSEGTQADFGDEDHAAQNAQQYNVPPGGGTSAPSPPSTTEEPPTTNISAQSPQPAETTPSEETSTPPPVTAPSDEGTLTTTGPQQQQQDITPTTTTGKKGKGKLPSPTDTKMEQELTTQKPIPRERKAHQAPITVKEIPLPSVTKPTPAIKPPVTATTPERKESTATTMQTAAGITQAPATIPATIAPLAPEVAREIHVAATVKPSDEKEKKENVTTKKEQPEDEEHYPIQVINNPDSSFAFTPQHKEIITDTTSANVTGAITPIGEIVTTVTDSTPTSPFMRLSPEAFALFEKMVGLITVHAESHVNTTTVVLNMPGSRFDKAQVVLQQFATAKGSLNVEIRCAPEALKVINDNIENLSAAFEASKLNFQVNLQRPILLPEYQVLSRKQEKGEEDRGQKRKQKDDYE
ncbi:MAG: hypothetical protein HY860_00370 [Chlamydiales bacterium]|nr:hypothetical protein [Chlamydiales bacterium]